MIVAASVPLLSKTAAVGIHGQPTSGDTACLQDLHQAYNLQKGLHAWRKEDCSWELRIGDLRVYDDVTEDPQTMTVVAIGFKRGNRLFIGDDHYLQRCGAGGTRPA